MDKSTNRMHATLVRASHQATMHWHVTTQDRPRPKARHVRLTSMSRHHEIICLSQPLWLSYSDLADIARAAEGQGYNLSQERQRLQGVTLAPPPVGHRQIPWDSNPSETYVHRPNQATQQHVVHSGGSCDQR